MADVELLRRIKTFTDELGVNLARAEVALKLVDRIRQLEAQVEALTHEVASLRPAGHNRSVTCGLCHFSSFPRRRESIELQVLFRMSSLTDHGCGQARDHRSSLT